VFLLSSRRASTLRYSYY